MINVTPGIFRAGSGTRLRPLSSAGFPKHYLCVSGMERLLQQAVFRLANLGNADR
jgi:mannose-1-phosphate guanylyltransferase/mannose-6-phosphate isomerase